MAILPPAKPTVRSLPSIDRSYETRGRLPQDRLGAGLRQVVAFEARSLLLAALAFHASQWFADRSSSSL